MNLLNINVQGNIPDIVDAYTKVFGVEYRELIEQRMNQINYVFYHDDEEISSYISFLQKCKQRELSIEFLEQIGIDVSKQKGKSYAEGLDKNLMNILDEYIGFWGMDPKCRNMPAGIKAWQSLDNDTNQEKIEAYKIRFINFLRGEGITQITKETFQEFCKTDEYKKLTQKIEEDLIVYNKVLEEYDGYLEEISPYQKYVDDESKRRRDLEKSKTISLCKKIITFLPDDMKSFLDEKGYSIEEISEFLFCDGLGLKSNMEYFSQEDEDKLNDSSIGKNEKDMIYTYRIMYFEDIGIKFDKDETDFENFKEFYEYCISQEYIKKLIPEQSLAKLISDSKKTAYEEFQKDFIYDSQDFIENLKTIGESEDVKKLIYQVKKYKSVFMTTGKKDEEFMALIAYTPLKIYEGALDYVLLHEVCHALEVEEIQNGHRSGFDICTYDALENPYNEQKRKYERINETITDIFAIEARQILHEKGIYILEPREYIKADVNDYNTHSIVKNLLTTFIDKYREPIIKARMYGDLDGLYNVIGEENFEELNDVVNRVDSLVGLAPKLKDNRNDDPVVVEYHKQLERLNQIYANMENYNPQNQLTDKLMTSVNITEKQTNNIINGKRNDLKEDYEKE